MRIVARAPSNIALVKYMGKADATENLPANPSLSMTLNELCTTVELELVDGGASERAGAIRWDGGIPAHAPAGATVPRLGDAGAARAIRHLERVRKAAPAILDRFSIEARNAPAVGWVFRSCNTFPPSSGIASSASSFAALTLAGVAAMARDSRKFSAAFGSNLELRRALASLSRRGSGSSCRSFEGPWVLWSGEDAAAVLTRVPKLAHFVVLISNAAKEVSSSAAHERVMSSPLWSGRIERATERTTNLLAALGEGDLATVSRIAWSEAWEMHSLFHTAAEPFTYWLPGTLETLNMLAPHIGRGGDEAVIVTLDAGPNVHISVPEGAREDWRRRLDQAFGPGRVLSDGSGAGAELVEA